MEEEREKETKSGKKAPRSPPRKKEGGGRAACGAGDHGVQRIYRGDQL